MVRDWSQARIKVETEGRCRSCGAAHGLDAAHIIPRSRIPGAAAMDARNIVPLCRSCHTSYDQDGLEMLGRLTREEETFIVSLVGIEEARRRTTKEAA